MEVYRKWSGSTYERDTVKRFYVEMPLPATVQPQDVRAIRLCLDSMYNGPDTLYVHHGDWGGAVDTVAHVTVDDMSEWDAWAEWFIPRVWNTRDTQPMATIPPVPWDGGCQEVTIPVTADTDGWLRLVFRTGDEARPEGNDWAGSGGANTFPEDYNDPPRPVILIYTP